MKIISLLILLQTNCVVLIAQNNSAFNANPINVSTDKISLEVDALAGRWSAWIRGTDMRINDAYFIAGNDILGWKITSAINKNDKSRLGDFTTVTLKGTKRGQLDFIYTVSASNHGNDILVSHSKVNNTGLPINLLSLDYFISEDVRLGGTSDHWRMIGTKSQLHHYYDFDRVSGLITPKSYEVNAVIRNLSTSSSLLLGHVTTTKGLSRFEVSNGYQGTTLDKMHIKGYCSYKIVIPAGKGFAGEKLLILFSDDAIKAMEHQGDMISLAADIRLKERRPIDLDDKEFVANNFAHFTSWMSGGNSENADIFLKHIDSMIFTMD